MPWDAAAGSLLVTEAGGYVGNFQGEGDFLFNENIIAANPKVFAALVSILSAYRTT
jgi:myo-inositol-1(or 4)-monophosphatase